MGTGEKQAQAQACVFVGVGAVQPILSHFRDRYLTNVLRTTIHINLGLGEAWLVLHRAPPG